ncbi:hypothetical protein [Selenomonas sp. AB3002]|uniref:hypothetical protein n=1 Tax=Selenomonas sp. AB3002 TaxID=1392502 RepID=UPI0004977EF8
MRSRRTIFLAVVLIVAVCTAALAYGRERTPEYALSEIAQGIASLDYEKVSRYADLQSVVTASYDESTAILCQDIERLSRMYPQDWFFRHDTAFMTEYMAERRDADLALILDTMKFFLTGDTPITRQEGEARWIADETAKFLQEYDAEVVKVEETDGSAVATIAIKGHDTPYGQLAPKLTLKVAMEEQQDGRWKVVRVSNVKELFYPVVDGIENYWTMQGWQ